MPDEAARSPAPPPGYEDLDLYARAIADQALRRGISVEVLDPRIGEIALSHEGRRVAMIQSLSELTSAVAYRRCSDKLHSRRIFESAGLCVPAGRVASFDDDDRAFLDKWKEIVVKPAQGERGEGVTGRVVDHDTLGTALRIAGDVCPTVVLEQRCPGEDLRVIVIDGEVAGASIRRPPTVTGDGRRTVRELIEERSGQRGEDTDGVAQISLDDATLEAIRESGYGFDSVLPEDTVLTVRDTANVHTGGTVDDVTDDVHPALRAAAVAAAEAIGCPVAGIDLIVPAIDGPDYVIIEANEQPGLSTDSEHRVIERFIDLLFPATADRSASRR